MIIQLFLVGSISVLREKLLLMTMWCTCRKNSSLSVKLMQTIKVPPLAPPFAPPLAPPFYSYIANASTSTTTATRSAPMQPPPPKPPSPLALALVLHLLLLQCRRLLLLLLVSQLTPPPPMTLCNKVIYENLSTPIPKS